MFFYPTTIKYAGELSGLKNVTFQLKKKIICPTPVMFMSEIHGQLCTLFDERMVAPAVY
jgi:hypothetical protein